MPIQHPRTALARVERIAFSIDPQYISHMTVVMEHGALTLLLKCHMTVVMKHGPLTLLLKCHMTVVMKHGALTLQFKRCSFFSFSYLLRTTVP